MEVAAYLYRGLEDLGLKLFVPERVRQKCKKIASWCHENIDTQRE